MDVQPTMSLTQWSKKSTLILKSFTAYQKSFIKFKLVSGQGNQMELHGPWISGNKSSSPNAIFYKIKKSTLILKSFTAYQKSFIKFKLVSGQGNQMELHGPWISGNKSSSPNAPQNPFILEFRNAYVHAFFKWINHLQLHKISHQNAIPT